jgi:hypothetical protein
MQLAAFQHDMESRDADRYSVANIALPVTLM